jgi:hypothetical protein
MAIGFYDLYKNLPMFNSFIGDYINWLEDLIYLRMTILMGYIIYFTGPFSYMFYNIFNPLVLDMAYKAIYPAIYIASCLKAVIILFYELLLPVQAVIILFFKTGWHLLSTVLYLPFIGVYWFLKMIYDGLTGVVLVFKSIGQSFQGILRIIKPVTEQENREASMSFFQIAYQLCLYWSQSLTKRVIQATKAIYDFIVYVGCEIGKHNYTITCAVYEKV